MEIKYREIMDRVKVTDAMRSELLSNIRSAAQEDASVRRPARIRRTRTFRRTVAAALSGAAIVAACMLALPSLRSTQPTGLQSEIVRPAQTGPPDAGQAPAPSAGRPEENAAGPESDSASPDAGQAAAENVSEPGAPDKSSRTAQPIRTTSPAVVVRPTGGVEVRPHETMRPAAPAAVGGNVPESTVEVGMEAMTPEPGMGIAASGGTPSPEAPVNAAGGATTVDAAATETPQPVSSIEAAPEPEPSMGPDETPISDGWETTGTPEPSEPPEETSEPPAAATVPAEAAPSASAQPSSAHTVVPEPATDGPPDPA